MIPVVLALPSILRYADTRQGLTSLALLGRGDTSSVDNIDTVDSVDSVDSRYIYSVVNTRSGSWSSRAVCCNNSGWVCRLVSGRCDNGLVTLINMFP